MSYSLTRFSYSNLSVSSVYKLTSLPANGSTMFSQSVGFIQKAGQATTAYPRFQIYDTGYKTAEFQTTALNAYNHQIGLTDAGTARIFVNGVTGTTEAYGTINNPNNVIKLGDFPTVANTGHIGTIQEIIAWDSNEAANRAGIESNTNSYYTIYGGYDPDALAYFTAAGITDTAEKDAVNQLVLNLKGTGSTPNNTNLWTDAAAFYPISPTSLAASAYNLRDTTSLNMTWANSPTHASTGVTFDGSTQYGDTGFNPSTASLANGYDLTLGMEIVNASVTAIGLMSAFLSTGSRTQMLLNSGNLYQDIHNVSGGRWVTSAGGTYQGRMIVSADRLANGGRTNYLNATSLGSKLSESSGTPVNLSLFVGAQNNGSGGQNFTAFEMRFGLIIPKGLNATAVADLDYAISTYNATVLVSDPDAAAFISSAGITSRAECEAVNQLVKDLKGTGSTTNNTDVWSDMNAIYPVSPTSLSAAAYNLKDPTSYNITWANSPTHSADGVEGNGSTQYGDTGFNINTNAALDSFGLTVYLNTYNALTSVEIGAYDTAFSQITGYAGGNTLSFLNQAGSGAVSTAGSAAVLTSVRTASNAIALYKDGVSVSTATTASTSKPNGDVYVLARNNIGVGAANLSTKRMAFAAIHAGLTANQAKDLYDAINTYNTALNR
jgi:hypothetical protein